MDTTTSHRRSNSLPQPHVGYLLQQEQREDSQGLYSSSHEKMAVMKSDHHRRTRPKTPVFAVGQLERASLIRQLDTAQLHADGYQFVLPPRIVTPCIDIEERHKPKRAPKTLRKIKCQLNLRDLVKDQDQYHSKLLPAIPPPTSSYSDAETLVQSDSAPSSPGKDSDDEVFYLAPTDQKPRHSSFDDSITLSDFNNDVGVKICINLLTNELASSLFKQHPPEAGNRASGLQILLMIEAYETVQQHVRRQLEDRHVMCRGGSGENINLEGVERMLDHWLQVLYSVYDRSQERRSKETLQSGDWPLHNLDEEAELSYH